MLIKEIYNQHIETISVHDKIGDVVNKMFHKKFNGFVVLDDKKKVAGILSLQDIAGAVVPRQFKHNVAMANAIYRRGFFYDECARVKEKKVSDIMRQHFISVSLDSNIMAVMTDFLNNDLYIVPVIEKNQLLGIVTRTEIKKALMDGMGVVHNEEL